MEPCKFEIIHYTVDAVRYDGSVESYVAIKKLVLRDKNVNAVVIEESKELRLIICYKTPSHNKFVSLEDWVTFSEKNEVTSVVSPDHMKNWKLVNNADREMDALEKDQMIKTLRESDRRLCTIIDNLKIQVDGLQRFKSYVHSRLDSMGVPKYENEECSIGKRLDYLEANFCRWYHNDPTADSKVYTSSGQTGYLPESPVNKATPVEKDKIPCGNLCVFNGQAFICRNLVDKKEPKSC